MGRQGFRFRRSPCPPVTLPEVYLVSFSWWLLGYVSPPAGFYKMYYLKQGGFPVSSTHPSRMSLVM